MNKCICIYDLDSLVFMKGVIYNYVTSYDNLGYHVMSSADHPWYSSENFYFINDDFKKYFTTISERRDNIINEIIC